MLSQILSQTEQNDLAIPFRLERFEDDQAILVFESLDEKERQEIKWPIRRLPENIKIGQQIWLHFSSRATRENERQAILRKLLETLLT